MAANYAAIHTAYNYLLPTYQSKSSPADSHNKSDLKNIYNAIRKMYNNSPIYLIDTSDRTKESAVELKDTSLNFQHDMTSFLKTSSEELMEHHIAYTTNDQIATMHYSGDPSQTVDPFSISVHALAKPQINTGTALPSNQPVQLTNQAYNFHVSIHELNYEFSLHINKSDTNLDLQERLANLVTKSNIGIQATVIDDAKGHSALRLESTNTGLPLGKDELFSISSTVDENTLPNSRFIRYFGLDQKSQSASNSNFSLNGDMRTTSSNTFLLSDYFEITLQGVSSADGESATLGLRPDIEATHNSIKDVLTQINDYTSYLSDYAASYPKGLSIMRDIHNAYANHKDAFQSIGITQDNSSKLQGDDLTLAKALYDKEEAPNFTHIRTFAKELSSIAKHITIHPMQYTEHKIVDYRNPQKTLGTPYITSAYSGFLFNSYC